MLSRAHWISAVSLLCLMAVGCGEDADEPAATPADGMSLGGEDGAGGEAGPPPRKTPICRRR